MEMMVVLAIISILTAIAGPEILKRLHSDSKVRSAAKEVVADFRTAQNESLRRGGGEMSAGGELIRKSVFIVFPDANSYEVWAYEDLNNDNEKTINEATRILSKSIPDGSTFGTLASVTATACGNGTGAPTAMTSFHDTDDDPPCNGRQCLEINANGFPTDAIGGTMYITDIHKEYAYAVNINAAGLLTLCKWGNGTWVIAR